MHPNVNLLGDPFNADGTVLDVTHAFALDYTVTHRGAVCFAFQFSRFGLTHFDYTNDNFVYMGTDKYPAYINSRGISAGYKLFARNKIAPLGRYIKWDAIVIFNKLVYKPNDVFDKMLNTRLTKVDENANSIGGGIALSFGRQRVFYNKIIVDGGFRLAMIICPTYYNSDYARRYFYVTERTIFNQLFNFRLGIGFLAF